MNYKIEGFEFVDNPPVALTCPHCGKPGTFEPLGPLIRAKELGTPYHVDYGLCRCPNPLCHGFRFYRMSSKGELDPYPMVNFPFDKKNLPDSICRLLDELSITFSNACYIASGILIRRILEELCHLQDIKGDTLKKRIIGLADKIVIPVALKEAFNELRLLGNDAAHVESTAFDEISTEEINIGVILITEILKATYQLDELLEKIQGLKKSKEAKTELQ